MNLTQQNDKWHVDAGRLEVRLRDGIIAWCFANWGGGWGEVDTRLDRTVFIFHQLAHANWFMLKWNNPNDVDQTEWDSV